MQYGPVYFAMWIFICITEPYNYVKSAYTNKSGSATFRFKFYALLIDFHWFLKGDEARDNDGKERAGGQGHEEPKKHPWVIIFWHDQLINDTQSSIGKWVWQT